MTLIPLVSLLTSWLDYLPGPATWNNNPLCRRADTGLAPSEWRECTHCQGTGAAKRGKTTLLCTHCAGHGGRYADPYDRSGQAIATAENGTPRMMTPAEIDAAIRHLTAGPGDTLLDALERDIRHRVSARPYQQLEHGLRALSRTDRFAAVLIAWTLIYQIQPPNTLPLPAKLALLRGLIALNHWLHDPARPFTFRPPAWAREPALKQNGRGRWANGHKQGQRNTEIRQRAANGEKTGRLAKDYGLSRRTLRSITEP